MRTRMVRVRRRGGGIRRAMVLLAVCALFYGRTALPALLQTQREAPGAVDHGERVTREIRLEGVQAHLICFGIWSAESEARVEAGRYVPRGAAGYVLGRADGYAVIGALYPTREQAERVCASLQASEGMACTTLEYVSGAVTLRMTAGSAQIDAFLNAERVLRETWNALGQLSFALDRREAGVEQALAVVQTNLDKALQAQETLRAQISQTASAQLSALSAMMEDVTGQMRSMLQERGAMALSSRLKFAQVEFALRHILWLQEIGESG